MQLTLSDVEEMEQEAKADLDALQRVRAILQRRQAKAAVNGTHKPRVRETGHESAAVREVLRAAMEIPTASFTVVDVARVLEKAGSGINKSTMFSAIRKLKAKGSIVTLSEGSGRRPAVYKLEGPEGAEKEFIHGRRDSPEP